MRMLIFTQLSHDGLHGNNKKLFVDNPFINNLQNVPFQHVLPHVDQGRQRSYQ